jgi:hypothetical protein
MFWTFGGLYLIGLQVFFCATFAWARWWNPELGYGSGFWIAGIGTIVLGIFALAFETVGLFWSPDRRPVRQILHAFLSLCVASVAVYGLGPFGEAAFLRLATTGNL